MEEFSLDLIWPLQIADLQLGGATEPACAGVSSHYYGTFREVDPAFTPFRPPARSRPRTQSILLWPGARKRVA
jgi:hypothetical protein